jgi:gliding motility-associated-like protein
MSRVAACLSLLFIPAIWCAGQGGPNAGNFRTEDAITINIAVTNTICAYNNGVIAVTASGGLSPYTYQSIAAAATNTTGIFPNLPAGVYDITVTDAAGVMASASTHLSNTFTPPFFLSEQTDPSGCLQSDGSIKVLPTGGLPPYAYSIDDGLTYQAGNVFPNLGAGFYHVFVKDADGCVTSPWSALGRSYLNYQTYSPLLDYIVLLNPNCNLQLSIQPSGAVCGNDAFIEFFAAEGGTPPYTYSLDAGPFAPNNSKGFYSLTPGMYSVYARDKTGLTISEYVDIPRNCPVSAVPAAALCGQNNGSITVTGAIGIPPLAYSIDGIHFQNTGNFINLTAGYYTVVVKDVNGATTAVNVYVATGCTAFAATVINLINASCGKSNGSLGVSVNNGMEPFQYSLDGVNFEPDSNFSGLAPGTYTIRVKDANLLVTTVMADIGNLPPPLVNAGSNMNICEGVGDSLQASSNGSSFAWSPATGLSDPAVLNPVASPDTTTQYTLTASAGSCTSTSSVTVFVKPAPMADPGPDTIICTGNSVQLQGSGGTTYSWSPPTYLNNPDIADPTVERPAGSIVYQLQVTGANGCASVGAATIKVTVTPSARVFAGNDTTVVAGQPLQLFAIDVNNSGFTGYQWSPARGLNNPFSPDPVVSVTGSITYTVVAMTPQGCTAEDSIAIKVYAFADIFVPNAFTPNGDGHNDILKAIPAGIRNFQYFVVYNRLGAEVFRTADPGKGWDGSLNGHQQSPGAFIWIAQGIDYQGLTIRRQGSVILIR